MINITFTKHLLRIYYIDVRVKKNPQGFILVTHFVISDMTVKIFHLQEH